jgi:uncharacterized protein (DUF433 family)
MDIKMPEAMTAALARAALARGQDPESLVMEFVEESLKMRQVPGITFADGPAGRRARVEGTGIEVFEIVEAYRAEGEDRSQLGIAFDWLDARQIDAALDYYREFPDDIEPRLTPIMNHA